MNNPVEIASRILCRIKKLAFYGTPTRGEKWKPITAHRGFEVSNSGRVREAATLRLLRWNTGTGYASVFIGGRFRYVHRLVAKAFVKRRPGRKYVHHKNHNRLDPRAENLQWVTSRENTAFEIAAGRHPTCLYSPDQQ